MFRRFSKKGIVELTSFVFITLLIVISATIAYNFSVDIINTRVAELDNRNMDAYLKYVAKNFDEILKFQDSQFSVNMEFNKGLLKVENNKIIYISFVEISDNSSFYCVDNLCYGGVSGYEQMYYNLTSPYNFSTNFSLSPGFYTLTFKNIKNESKIEVVWK